MLNLKSVSGKDFGLVIIGEYYNNIVQMLKLAIKIAAKIAHVNWPLLELALNTHVPRLILSATSIA